MCILHAQPCHKLELAVYNLKAASSCACWFQPANMNHPNGVMWFIHPQISLNGLISQVTSCVVIFRGVDLRPRGVFFPQQQWIIDSPCWICWKSYSALYPFWAPKLQWQWQHQLYMDTTSWWPCLSRGRNWVKLKEKKVLFTYSLSEQLSLYPSLSVFSHKRSRAHGNLSPMVTPTCILTCQRLLPH